MVAPKSDTDQTFFLYEPPRSQPTSQENKGDKTLTACSAGWGTTEEIKDGIKKNDESDNSRIPRFQDQR